MNTEVHPSHQPYSVWGLPGTLIWGLIIAVFFVATQSIVMGIYIGINHGKAASSDYGKLVADLQYNGQVLSICTFASSLVCGLMLLGAVKLKKNSNLKHYLGFKAVDLQSLKFWFLVIISLIIVSDLLTLLLGKPIVPEFMTTIYKSTESKWLLWLALIVAAPLFEELFFRGFLIPGISSSFLGPVGAIVISATLWAAIHFQYDLYGMATIFVMGIVFGIARIKSGSVLLTIGLHSFLNLAATTQVFVSQSV